MYSTKIVNKLKLILIILLYNSSLKILFAQNLEEIIVNEHFFDILQKKYENINLTEEIKKSIDQEVHNYINNISKQIHVIHSKKMFLDFNIQRKGPRVFETLQEILSFNSSNVEEMYFFKKYNEQKVEWYGATLALPDITIHLFREKKLIPVAIYPIAYTTKMRVIEFFGDIFFVVQNDHCITVLHFYGEDNKYTIHEIQRIDIENIKDFSLLSTSNLLFMAASTLSQVYVYISSDGSFVRRQILPRSNIQGVNLFQINNEVHLLLQSKHSKDSLILDYSWSDRRFQPSQPLGIHAIDLVLIRPSGSETLLAVASSSSTLVYKRIGKEGPFVSLQEIGAAEQLTAIAVDRAVLLLLLNSGVLEVYQYDGWRFVRLGFRLAGVKRVEKVTFDGEEVLILRWADGSWSFNRINWMEAESLDNLNGNLRRWLLNTEQKIKKFWKTPMGMRSQIHLSKEQVQKFKVSSVNKINIEKLQNLTERYELLMSRLSAVNESLNHFMPEGAIHLSNLRVKIARVNCTRNCKANKLVNYMKCDFLSNLRKIDNKTQTLRFERVKINRLDEFPCPVPGIRLEEINIEGSINEMSFKNLQNNLLKKSGDQIITGEMTFEELRVESLLAPHLEMASTRTRQRLRAAELHTHELNLVSGGLLLPLDGDPVRMSGRLWANQAKFDGLVHLRGHVDGPAVRRILPSVHLPGRHVLQGNYSLTNNLVIATMLAARDLERSRGGKSFGEIAAKALPLDAEKIPVRLLLSENSTVWSNVTVKNLPNWLTRKVTKPIVVMGKKITLQNITLPAFLYSKLPVPKLETQLCSDAGAVASDVRISTLKIGKATAKFIEVDKIFGTKEMRTVLADAATSLNEVDLSRKSFTGTIYVENTYISDLENSPFHSFLKAKFKWYQPNTVEGSFHVQNLKVDSLIVSRGLKIPFPEKLENLIVEGNLQVKRINQIDLEQFSKDTIKINDTLTLKNITFENLEVHEIETLNTNIEIYDSLENFYLRNKVISGTLIIENDLSISNILSHFTDSNNMTNMIIEGSIVFENEPYVEKLNGKSIKTLLSEVWIASHPLNLIGNFTMKNVTLLQPFNLHKLYTPYFGSWKSLENRLLSKTKSQEIKVPVYFKNIEIRNILTLGNSSLYTSDPYLSDLLKNTLRNTKRQIVKENWRIEKLVIKDNMKLHGKINNLNLSSDVVRHGIENKIVGQKIVDELSAVNLDGLNFYKWTEDALILSDTRKFMKITGKKSFNTFSARRLNVNGTIMGNKLEEFLLKTDDQVIGAPKTIEGSMHVSLLTVKGLINDVNLTEVENYRLKQYASVQSIDSEIIFKGNFEVLGNFTTRETFKDIDLSNIRAIDETLDPVIKSFADLKSHAVEIKAALKHRAKYWNKFEQVDEIPMSFNNIEFAMNNISFYKLGNCFLISTSQWSCDGQSNLYLKTFVNESEIVLNKMMSVESIPIVVQVSSGQRSRITIYMYNYTKNHFDMVISVRVPGIVKAQTASLGDVVWVAAQLASHMLLVRYELSCKELNKYHLPATRAFALGYVPTSRELVLAREDGVWRLDGLDGPKNAFPVNLEANWIETIATNGEFYVNFGDRINNVTTILRARYVGF